MTYVSLNLSFAHDTTAQQLFQGEIKYLEGKRSSKTTSTLISLER